MTRTILIVDDRSINREFIGTLLTYAGYRVIEAADGGEALDLARAWHPHLIITDILMPSMDGTQLVQRLRADPGLAAIPVIFYTATYRLAEARDLAKSCGVSEVIAKPSEPEVVLQAVMRAIDSVRRAAPPVVVGLHTGRRTKEMYVSERFTSWMRDLTDLQRDVKNRDGASSSPADRLVPLFTRVQALAMRLAAMIELGLDLPQRRRPEDLIAMYCRAAQDIVNAKYAGVVILKDDGRRVRYFATRGLDDAQAGAVRAAFDPTTKVLKQLLGEGGPQRLRDLEGDPTAAGLPTVHPPFDSFLAVPLRSMTRTYGLLYLAERLGGNSFSDDDEQFALMIAGQLSPAYENLSLYGELRKYADRLELEMAGRRRATENLRESEERYRLLWETTTDAVILIDPSNRIQHANPAIKAVFGHEPADVVGQDLGMLQPPRLRDAHRRALARYLESGEKTVNWRGTETTGLRRDGSEFPVEIAFSQLFIGGKPVFAAYVRDISQRKRAETALRESEALLEQAQEIGAMGSWMSRLNGENSLWWSREAYRLFGVPEGTPVTLESFRAIVHPDDRERVQRAAKRAMDTHTPYVIDHRIVLPDGQERWIHERADVVIGENGLPRMIGVAQDVTEYKEQQDKIARLSRIYAVLSGINSAIVRVHERQALFAEVCRVTVEAGRFPFAWVGAVDRLSGRVTPVAQFGDDQGLLDLLTPRMLLAPEPPDTPSLIAQAVREKRAMLSNDVSADERVRFRHELRERNIGSIVTLPLLVSGDVVAVLAMPATEPGFFNDEEMSLLNELAGDISFGLQYIDKAEQLEYLAFYDALTGLPNGNLFHDRLNQLLHGAKPDEEFVAVVVLDLDRFTQLNDTLGRHVGDVLLQTVARRLTNILLEPFSLARIGADTFAVAIANLRQRADAAATLRKRIFAALSEPMQIEDREVRVSARAGIALYPGDGLNADALFKNAEAALQQARASGERFLYYSPEINATVADRLALESRLRQATERHEFVLYYQPKVDVQTGRVIGLEALVRWNDPERGLRLPEEFIDVLEETALILDLGRWVLHQALSDYQRWSAKGLQPPPIAVNVSPLQLRQANFADSVRAALDAHGAGSAALEIELTESLIMEDIDSNIETLRRINRTGVRIAVDDFGTGYSSLRYLAKLPVDSLKIDRSFIVTMAHDRDSMTIVATIISLAHSLGLRVVAEGVDSPKQVAELKRLGCDEMQGNLHSEALAPDRVEAILQSGVTPRR